MDEPSRILVRRAQAADRDAFGVLVERYRQRVRGALRRMLRESAEQILDSEDATQDAVLAALSHIDRFEYRGHGSFLAWLLQTARNELLQRMRAARAQKRGGGRPLSLASEDDAIAHDGPAPSQVAAGRELEDRIQACLATMSAPERQAILLRRYLGAEFSEIRDELDLPSPGAARALLSRAQVRLAQLLDGTD